MVSFVEAVIGDSQVATGVGSVKLIFKMAHLLRVKEAVKREGGVTVRRFVVFVGVAQNVRVVPDFLRVVDKGDTWVLHDQGLVG